MGLGEVSRTWNRLGREDPMWAVLTEPGTARGRWDTTDFLATGEREIRAVLDRAAELGAPPATRTARDFGCGAGRLTYGLARAGFDTVIGVDLSEGMLSTAAELTAGEDRCRFLHNDGPTLGGIEDETVDFVYSSRVLQHMPPDLALGYVREFFRVTRPGGTVVFQLPTRPARTVPGLVVRVLPRAVLDRLRKGMEMHGTAEGVVRASVESCAGAVLAADDDDRAGTRWESRLYFCRAGEGRHGAG